MNNQPESKDETPPAFDEVLKRMLSAPPQPKTTDKPADKKNSLKRVKSVGTPVPRP